MSIQLPLPGVWPANASWPDAQEQLDQLKKDALEAKAEIRDVLDKYAGRYGIDAQAVNGLIYGYVDDIINDLFFDKEDELRDEIEGDIEREKQVR
jgi:hypothetical protein